MDKDFKFIIASENEEFENNYIMKYRCSCGGKYQILLREKLHEKSFVYNLIKTMCIVCNRPGEFLFDITGRVDNKSEADKEKAEKAKEPKKPRRKRAINSPYDTDVLSGVAKEIQDAFISFGSASELPFNIEDIGKPAEASRAGHDKDSGRDYEKLKFLYAQAMMKIRYLEEENRQKQEIEDRLKKMETEIENKNKTIEELIEEIEDKTGENKDLQRQVTKKDKEIETYKKLHEEKKQPGWKKLLGG